MLLNRKFSDMTVECGDGKLFPAHRAIVCARSSFFYTAMEANMQERETKTISLPEPSMIVSKLLQFLYTGHYGAEQRNGEKVERLASFKFNLHVATLADRLLMQDLYEVAKANMRGIVNGIELESLDDLILCVKAVYGDDQDIEYNNLAAEAGRQAIVERIAREKIFERMKRQYPEESLLQDSAFLSDLVVQNEYVAHELSMPKEPSLTMNQFGYL